MLEPVPSFSAVATFGCLALLFAIQVDAQTEAPRNSEKKRREIDLADLPTPPKDIAELIRHGQVRFFSGGSEPVAGGTSEITASVPRSPGNPLPPGHPRPPGNLQAPGKLDAATSYRFTYTSPNQTTWSRRLDGGRQRVVIRVRYSDITLQTHHEIWLRHLPSREDFWTDKLVRHELDHVRISSDRRLAKRFAESLRESAVIDKEVPRRTVINNRLTDRLVDEHTKSWVEKINQLIAIRYRELDRVTDHGRKVLPEASPLHSLIRP